MRYLSVDWIDAVADEAATNARVTQAAADCSIGVTQVITDAPEGTIVYSMQVLDGCIFAVPLKEFVSEPRWSDVG